MSGKPSDASSGQCPRPVPDPHVRPWQRERAKLRVPPKGHTSHPCVLGQGKPGRVTASESLKRSRHSRLPEPVASQDGRLEPGVECGCHSRRGAEACVFCVGTPGLRDKEDTHPKRISPVWNVETPLRSGRRRSSSSPPVSQPPVRTAQRCSGTGWPKKRTPPAERHGEAITRRIGDALHLARGLTWAW
jgi:hypothetical protein